MLYFSKLAQRENQISKMIYFLSQINLAKENQEFQTHYWQLLAEANESTHQYQKSIEAYQKVFELNATDGDKAFASLQMQRLEYLLKR